jgi:hypothetical protein
MRPNSPISSRASTNGEPITPRFNPGERVLVESMKGYWGSFVREGVPATRATRPGRSSSNGGLESFALFPLGPARNCRVSVVGRHVGTLLEVFAFRVHCP